MMSYKKWFENKESNRQVHWFKPAFPAFTRIKQKDCTSQ